MTIQIGPTVGEPLSLVRDAVRHKENAHRQAADKHEPYDEVWCVIDVEAPSPHEGLPKAIRLANDSGVHLALTNPCFELWIVWHHQEHCGYSTSAQAQRQLERVKNCGYDVKTKRLDCSGLAAGEEMASARAKRLRAGASGDGTETNPWTNLDVMIAVLKDPAVETVSGFPHRCIPTEFRPRRP